MANRSCPMTPYPHQQYLRWLIVRILRRQSPLERPLEVYCLSQSLISVIAVGHVVVARDVTVVPEALDDGSWLGGHGLEPTYPRAKGVDEVKHHADTPLDGLLPVFCRPGYIERTRYRDATALSIV